MNSSGTECLADARLSDALDGITLVPRHGPAWRLKARLEELVPGINARSSAEGVTIPPLAAPDLLDVDDALGLEWSAEARRAVDNRRDARARQPRLRAAVRGLGNQAANARNVLVGIDDIETLDDHQVINVAALTHPDCFGMCLFDEQGAGKTVSVIYAYDLLAKRDDVDGALVVAPKSMVAEWGSDLKRFMGSLHTAELVVGGRRQKLDALRSGADVLVTNFETVVSLEDELRALLRAADGRRLLVVDESFMVKNLDAHRTRALKRLREWAGRTFVLCGTPAPNSPHDVVEQVNLADFGITFEGVDIPDERGSALPVVRRALEDRGVYLRSLKRDVLRELPAKAMQVVRLPFAPQQGAAYEAALKSLILDLRKTDDEGFRRQLTSFMARRSALLQICSNPARVVPGYDELPAKLVALDRLLEDWIVGRGEKVVVWSFFTRSLDVIVERYGDYGLVRYDGSTPVADRRVAVSRFQGDNSTRLFVGNPAAAGAGLTLHAARLAIYESLSNQAAHYLQSLDRIHRRGQERPVEYTFLVCDGSIEETDLQGFRRKERSAQELLGDPFDSAPTREAMLGELMSTAALRGSDAG